MVMLELQPLLSPLSLSCLPGHYLADSLKLEGKSGAAGVTVYGNLTVDLVPA